MSYQIKMLQACKWRKNQNTIKPGEMVKLEEEQILDVPDEISELDALEMCNLEIACLIEDSDEDLDETEDESEDETDEELDGSEYDTYDEDLDITEDQEVTQKDVRELLKEVKDTHGNEKYKEILSEFGYSAVNAISKDDYIAITNMCKEVLTEEIE